MKKYSSSIIVFFLAGFSLLWADAPGIINYQGKLTDQNGNPITDNAGLGIVFSLYNVPSGGSFLFQETRSVPIDNGVFTVQIGSETAGGIPKSIFQTNTTLYLGVKVGADAEMMPRERLVSAPYALAIATGSVGQQEIINSTITLAQVDTASFDTRYITSSPSTMTVTYSVLMATQAGRVGVGTLNPSYEMHVATAAGTTSTLFAVSTGSVDLFRVSGTSVALKVPLFLSDGTELSSAGNYVLKSGDTMAGQLTVLSEVTFAYNAFSVGGSTLTIVLGKVGIGTNSPNYQLHVTTAAGTTGTLFAVSTGAVDLFRVNGTSVALKVPLYFPDGTFQETAAATAGNLDSTYVNEGQALSISAGMIVDGATLSEIADDDGAGSGLDADLLDGLSSAAFAAATHQSTHMDGGADRLTGSLTLSTATVTGTNFSVGGSTLVVKEGKVGIGTTSPNYILVVSTAAGTEGTLFAVTTGPVDLFRVSGTSAALKVPLYLMDGTPLTTVNQFQPAGNYVLRTGDTISGQLTVQSSVTFTNNAFSVGGGTLTTNLGKVGVGTTSPSYQLHMTTAAGTTSTLFAVSTGPVDLFKVSGASVALKVPLYFPDGTVQVTAAETSANLDSTYVNEGQALSISAGMIVDGATLSEIADDDGAGSGLDADLLDGLSSAAFAAATHQSTHVDGGADRLTGSLTLTTATLTGSDFSVGGGTFAISLGNVGIGTTAPSNNLHISSLGDAAVLLAADTDNATESDNPYIKFTQDGVGGKPAIIGLSGGTDVGPDNAAYTGAADSDFIIGTQGAASVLVGANNVVRLAVSSVGKVGIGTTNPSYQLHVTTAAGTTSTLFAVSTGPVDLFRVNGTSAALKVPLYFPDGTVQVTAAETSANLDSTYVNEGQALSISAGMIVDGATLSEIADDDGAGSGLDADLLDGLSSAAFADTSHQSTHVDGGTDRLTGSLTLTTATLTGSNFSVAGTTFVVVHGDVGIGTTNPSFMLHITTTAGTTSTMFSVSTGPVDLFKVSGASAALKVPLYFQDGTAQGTAYTGTAAHQSTHVDGGADRLTGSLTLTTATLTGTGFSVGTSTFVVKAGEVGIGTTSPGYQLQVHSPSGKDSDFALSDGDVAHGLTTIAPTDVWMLGKPISSTQGGAQVTGMSDVAGATALQMRGIIGNTDPTDTVPAVQVVGGKKSGTNIAALGSLETVFQVLNNTTQVMTALGDGKVGIGTTVPKTTLDVNGGFSIEMQNRTGTYTADTGDFGITADATSGGFTITLPAASNNGMMIYIKKTDATANVVTISRAGSDTIEGSTSKTLSAQYEYIHLVANGTATWYIKSRSPIYEP